MPVWYETIELSDVWHSEDLDWSEIRDIACKRIKDSQWYKDSEDDLFLHHIVDELGHSADRYEFNEWWNEFYDLADRDRIWIATF